MTNGGWVVILAIGGISWVLVIADASKTVREFALTVLAITGFFALTIVVPFMLMWWLGP